MCKIILVKAFYLLKCFISDDQERATCPKNRSGLIILAFILLYAGENPATAKRVSQAVYKSTRCASILEMPRVVIIQNFGLGGCNCGVSLKKIKNGRQPVRRNLDITVQ